MKICDLTQFYSDSGGGIRTYLDMKRKYIQQHTHFQHVLIVPGEKDSCVEDGQLKMYRVKAARIPGSVGYRFILRLNKVFSILKSERPDVIEFATPYVLPWVVYWYQKFYPCQTYGFYHTDFPHAYVNIFFSRLFGSRAGQFFEKIAYRYAQFVYNYSHRTLTASRILAHKLAAIGVQTIHVIPFGVDLSLFHPLNRDEKFRQKFIKHRNDILLLYAGRFDTEKRVLFLLEAFEKLKTFDRFSLVMIGEGPQRAQLEDAARNNKRLHILPFANNKIELAKLYASADIYVTAGPHETFGFCIAEAQASGIPVAGVYAGALIERVPETLGFLAPVDSATEMTKNIIRLSELDFHALGLKNRQWVEQNNSWENFFTQLFHFYETASPTIQAPVPKLTDEFIPVRH